MKFTQLATANTPAHLIVNKIFIKRNYKPSVKLLDAAYVLPTEYDDTHSVPSVDPITPGDNDDRDNKTDPIVDPNDILPDNENDNDNNNSNENDNEDHNNNNDTNENRDKNSNEIEP